jgi:hypothetical protein
MLKKNCNMDTTEINYTCFDCDFTCNFHEVGNSTGTATIPGHVIA